MYILNFLKKIFFKNYFTICVLSYLLFLFLFFCFFWFNYWYISNAEDIFLWSAIAKAWWSQFIFFLEIIKDDYIEKFFNETVLVFVEIYYNYICNFFKPILLNSSLDSIWCSLLFDTNITTSLILNYQNFVLVYPTISLNSEYFFILFKFFPYIIDIYLIFFIFILSIFICLGKWILYPEIKVYWISLNVVKIITLFYFQLLIFQYYLFCFNFKMGPLFYYEKTDVHFGEFDSWVFLVRFLTALFFLLFFYIIGDFVNTIGYLWSFESILFLLISFEMLFIIISTNNLLILLTGITGISIVMYILIAFERTYSSLEASIKYFCLSAVAAGIMIFGYTLIYHINSGILLNSIISNNYLNEIQGVYLYYNFSDKNLLDFTNIFIQNLDIKNIEIFFLIPTFFIYQIGFIFFLVGFFFKLSLFPCYIWAPDVYEGAPTIIVGFMVIMIKFVIFLTLIRVIFIFYNFDFFFWYLFKIIGCFSIIIGSVGALIQQKIKRFIAYTSINQMGLLLLGLAFDPLNMVGSLFGLLVYVTTNLIFFGILLSAKEIKTQRLIIYMSDLHNLFISSPKNIIYFTVAILSMSGIPPFAGFFGKYFLLLPIINSKFGIFYGIFLLSFHIIGTFNYLRLIRDMWFYDLSKLLSFYSCLSNKNLIKIQILTFFQFMCFFGLDYILLFCNYWRWTLSTIFWC